MEHSNLLKHKKNAYSVKKARIESGRNSKTEIKVFREYEIKMLPKNTLTFTKEYKDNITTEKVPMDVLISEMKNDLQMVKYFIIINYYNVFEIFFSTWAIHALLYGPIDYNRSNTCSY